MRFILRTQAASTLRYSSTTRAEDLSSRDWHGLRASGSGPGSRARRAQSQRRACVHRSTLKLRLRTGSRPKQARTTSPAREMLKIKNLTGAAETKTENAETPPPPPDGNGNSLFATVKNPNARLTALHAALPPRTALLLFSEHSDPRSMSTLAARRGLLSVAAKT
ncbi:hypothetical protein BJY52DRAFT_156805 [Lactarius psammicola]|nr:hypothetical protein BJY52DRAFT_156805 [Lactarius psammicola]